MVYVTSFLELHETCLLYVYIYGNFTHFLSLEIERVGLLLTVINSNILKLLYITLELLACYKLKRHKLKHFSRGKKTGRRNI